MRSRIVTTILLAYALPALADDALEFRLAEVSPTNDWVKVQFERESLWLSPKPLLTSADVTSAEFKTDPSLSPKEIAQLKKIMPESAIDTNRQVQVSITFNEHGKALFAELTAKNCLKRLAILSRGRILIAPVIREQITDGVAVIRGKFSEAEARELATKLSNKKSNKDPETTQ